MDRLDINSMYSTNQISSQWGGSKSPRSKSPRSKSPTRGNIYNPSGIDGATESAIYKFRKANRLLQKELNEVKEQLKKEQQKTKKLEKQIEISSI